MSSHETDEIQRLRRENLAGLSGRVLEVGAGTGTNFAFYPATVTEVVAVEPERRLAPSTAQRAAANAPVPVIVSTGTVEKYLAVRQAAVRRGRVLAGALLGRRPGKRSATAAFAAAPGGELRYLEHVASSGVRGRLQKFADATVWPRMMGNCHTHRDTEASHRRRRASRWRAHAASRRCRRGFRRRWRSTRSAAPSNLPSSGEQTQPEQRRNRDFCVCSRMSRPSRAARAAAAAASARRPPRSRAPCTVAAVRQRCAFGIDLDHRNAVGQRQFGQPGGGVDDRRRADHDHDVGVADRLDRLLPRGRRAAAPRTTPRWA